MSDRIDDADVARFGLAAMISPNALLPTEEVEAVAKALADADWVGDDCPPNNWFRLTGLEQDRYRKSAEAVMRALAKPDEGVVG